MAVLGEVLQWLTKNAAWLVSAWAVWIAVRGRRLDARRAYSEFVLKQRIDAAAALMQASARHVGLLADVADTRRRISAGDYPPNAVPIMNAYLERRLAEMADSIAKLDDANAAALIFFSNDLLAAARGLHQIHHQAIAQPYAFVLDEMKAQQAAGRILDVIRRELDIEGVIEYQKGLFRKRRGQKPTNAAPQGARGEEGSTAV
jgi:hypothetical protein